MTGIPKLHKLATLITVYAPKESEALALELDRKLALLEKTDANGQDIHEVVDAIRTCLGFEGE